MVVKSCIGQRAQAGGDDGDRVGMIPGMRGKRFARSYRRRATGLPLSARPVELVGGGFSKVPKAFGGRSENLQRRERPTRHRPPTRPDSAPRPRTESAAPDRLQRKPYRPLLSSCEPGRHQPTPMRHAIDPELSTSTVGVRTIAPRLLRPRRAPPEGSALRKRYPGSPASTRRGPGLIHD